MRTRLTSIVLLLLMVASPLSAQQPKLPAVVPPGVPAPSVADAARIAEVMAFEKQCDEAAVKGDVGFLERALSNDFVMTHGDGWTAGGAPLKVDTKATWIAYVGKQPPPYVYRNLDSIQVELHGDIAITIGRYRYLPRTSSPTPASGHLYVWFERVYATHGGRWQFLSHRTVKGPVREDDDQRSTGTR
jgi:hypothetical protein